MGFQGTRESFGERLKSFDFLSCLVALSFLLNNPCQ